MLCGSTSLLSEMHRVDDRIDSKYFTSVSFMVAYSERLTGYRSYCEMNKQFCTQNGILNLIPAFQNFFNCESNEKEFTLVKSGIAFVD